MLTSQDLAFFVVLAREPSLAAVARALDVTPPAVSQRLQSLERRLGVRLVDRTGGRLSLTGASSWSSAGGEFWKRWKPSPRRFWNGVRS